MTSVIDPQSPEQFAAGAADAVGTIGNTIREVVACSDGSTSTGSLLEVSAVAAAALGVPLRVLHARQGPQREKEFEAARHAAETLGVALDIVEAVEQTPWEVNGAILAYFRERPGVVPVLAAHARHSPAKILLGSVSSVMIRELGRPALVVGPQARVPERISRVMVAVDGSHFSDRAVDVGVAFARQLDVELWLVEVLEKGTASATNLAGAAWKLGVRDPHLRVGWETLHGSKADQAIVEYVGGDPSTVLVAATHGRTALSELVLGSVANGLVRHAVGPVLLVRPPEPAADPASA
ncbi:MAG: universal stress protein [Acidimicrobiales bacterium]